MCCDTAVGGCSALCVTCICGKRLSLTHNRLIKPCAPGGPGRPRRAPRASSLPATRGRTQAHVSHTSVLAGAMLSGSTETCWVRALTSPWTPPNLEAPTGSSATGSVRMHVPVGATCFRLRGQALCQPACREAPTVAVDLALEAPTWLRAHGPWALRASALHRCRCGPHLLWLRAAGPLGGFL